LALLVPAVRDGVGRRERAERERWVDRRERLAPRAVGDTRQAVLQEVLVVDVADRAHAPAHRRPDRRAPLEAEELALLRDVRRRLERERRADVRVEHLVTGRAFERLSGPEAL